MNRVARTTTTLIICVLTLAGSLLAQPPQYVSTVSQFQTAVGSANSGLINEIVLMPGTYNLTQCAYLVRPGITIRGSTGNRDDVVLYGGGMNNSSGVYEAIQLTRNDCTVKDLTLSGFYHHAMHFQSGANNAIVDNVHTLNIGEHHMKGAFYNSNGTISNCLMEQDQVRLNGMPDRPDEYVGGVDLLGATGWTIRDNVIHDIHGTLGDGDPGIFLWQDINNCTIERNRIYNVNKGIGLGNPSSSNGANGCIVRNNFIYQETHYNDVGIELWSTVNCKVYNNTVFASQPGYNWFRTLQIGATATGLDIQNNIFRGGVQDNATGDWSAAAVVARGNIVDTSGSTVAANWFTLPATADMHLTDYASAAIGTGVSLADVTNDFDRQLRVGTPDMGGDEVCIVGDLDGDGFVGGLDLNIVLGAWGQNVEPGLWSAGDPTGDGFVGGTDLNIVLATWGHGTPPTPAVPEPTTLGILACAGILAFRQKK